VCYVFCVLVVLTNQKGDVMKLRDVDTKWAWNDAQHSAYLCTNTTDPDFDISGAKEFKDVDDEYYGLTIIEFDNVLQSRLWLIGSRC